MTPAPDCHGCGICERCERQLQMQARMSQVIAAFITPDCRVNRGDEGAWEEAAARLKAEYDAVLGGWKNEPEQPTLNLILDLERPESGS